MCAIAASIIGSFISAHEAAGGARYLCAGINVIGNRASSPRWHAGMSRQRALHDVGAAKYGAAAAGIGYDDGDCA